MFTLWAESDRVARCSIQSQLRRHATLNRPEQLLSATRGYRQGPTPTQFCLLALASSGAQGIRTNGARKANVTGST